MLEGAQSKKKSCWWDVILPLDADDEDELSLSRDVGGITIPGDTGETELLLLSLAVLLNVLLSTLEDLGTLLLVGLIEIQLLASWSSS